MGKEIGNNVSEIIKSLNEETLKSIKDVEINNLVFFTNLERYILNLLQSMDVGHLRTLTEVDEQKENFLGNLDGPSLESTKWLHEGILNIMKQLDESTLKLLKDIKQQLLIKINNLANPSGPANFKELVTATGNVGSKNSQSEYFTPNGKISLPKRNPLEVLKEETFYQPSDSVFKSETCEDDSNVKRKRVDTSPTMHNIAKQYGFDIDNNLEPQTSTVTSSQINSFRNTNQNSRWGNGMKTFENQKKTQWFHNGFANQRRKRKRICSWPNKTCIPQDFPGSSHYDEHDRRWEDTQDNPPHFQPFDTLGNRSYAYGRNKFSARPSFNFKSSWNYYN